MATKKKPVRRKPTSRKPARSVRPQSRPKRRPRKGSPGSDSVSKQAFDSLNERLDIMLPEVMFRIAALEHLLVEKGYCSHDQLSIARQYIQEQEKT